MSNMQCHKLGVSYSKKIAFSDANVTKHWKCYTLSDIPDVLESLT